VRLRVGSSISGQRAFDASQFSTVDTQFAFIQEQLEKHPRRVHIEYDPDDGHPTNVYFALVLQQTVIMGLR